MNTTTKKQEILYGWYSAKQAKMAGEIAYEAIGGESILVSEVSDDPNYKPNWNDSQFVGEVVAWKFKRLDYGTMGQILQ